MAGRTHHTLSALWEDPGPLAANGLGLWLLNAEQITDDDLSSARDWLDPEERAKAARFDRPGLTRDYEIAHAFFRRVVGSVVGLPPASVVIGREPCSVCGQPHGRPTTEGAHLSLSHTSGHVLVAIADRPVGVDIERYPDDVSDLVSVLHPRERAEIEAAPHEARERFTRAWTRKEAYLKLLGVGLNRDPALDFVGTSASTDPRWIELTVVGPYAAVCTTDP